MQIASARATGPDLESLCIFLRYLLIYQVEIKGKLPKSRISKNLTEKPEKTVFLSYFVIFAIITSNGRFLAKIQ